MGLLEMVLTKLDKRIEGLEERLEVVENQLRLYVTHPLRTIDRMGVASSTPYPPNQTQPTTQPEPADEKVEISYTDPKDDFIKEMREKLGLVKDEELSRE